MLIQIKLGILFLMPSHHNLLALLYEATENEDILLKLFHRFKDINFSLFFVTNLISNMMKFVKIKQ